MLQQPRAATTAVLLAALGEGHQVPGPHVDPIVPIRPQLLLDFRLGLEAFLEADGASFLARSAVSLFDLVFVVGVWARVGSKNIMKTNESCTGMTESAPCACGPL